MYNFGGEEILNACFLTLLNKSVNAKETKKTGV